MSIRLSPRHEPVALARIEIAKAVCESAMKHDLTTAELMAILLDEARKWIKCEIKNERKEV